MSFAKPMFAYAAAITAVVLAIAVALDFTQPGGQASQAQGTLPLYHSVVIDDRDHRFTVQVADTRGFVAVTEQVCAYP